MLFDATTALGCSMQGIPLRELASVNQARLKLVQACQYVWLDANKPSVYSLSTTPLFVVLSILSKLFLLFAGIAASLLAPRMNYTLAGFVQP